MTGKEARLTCQVPDGPLTIFFSQWDCLHHVSPPLFQRLSLYGVRSKQGCAQGPEEAWRAEGREGQQWHLGHTSALGCWMSVYPGRTMYSCFMHFDILFPLCTEVQYSSCKAVVGTDDSNHRGVLARSGSCNGHTKTVRTGERALPSH